MNEEKFRKLAHTDYGYGKPADCLDFSWSYAVKTACGAEYLDKDIFQECSCMKGLPCKFRLLEGEENE